MNIGSYTFHEFKALATSFHGYPAPGLLIGGYMVEMAKHALPEGILYEAVVESRKCLPDAVQLLTPCSAGNNWMKIHNLGRYALSLFDKHTGEGVRVHLDAAKLGGYPEIRDWFLKRKTKAEQDEARLFAEIEAAGNTICTLTPVRVRQRFLGHKHMSAIKICPLCEEAYPESDGPVCRGCQGEAPYVTADLIDPVTTVTATKVIPVEDAVGSKALHDMTRVAPGIFKGPEILAGQTITGGDLCRLQKMGRFCVAVEDEAKSNNHLVHENEAAERFAARMAGEGVSYDLPPREGKINFKACRHGLFTVDRERLYGFNLVPEVMLATRQDATLVRQGTDIAGTRIIPLHISHERLEQALAVLGEEPLFSVLPLREACAGILVTGTEVFQGIIQDGFIPIITAKINQLGGRVVKTIIVPDDKTLIVQAVEEIQNSGADLLVTTGGLSVDPDDVTRQALLEAGLTNILHGAPVLPGTMSLMGRLGKMQVVGVPACALYHKVTFLDLLLPRLLAGREISRAELAHMGEGGFCLSCKTCSWPRCAFGK